MELFQIHILKEIFDREFDEYISYINMFIDNNIDIYV